MGTVIVANAIVQATLVISDPVPSRDPLAPLLAIISAASLVLTGAVVVSAARQVADGPVTLRAAVAGARAHFWLLVLWLAIWTVVLSMTSAIAAWLGAVIAALTPFVAIAASAGCRNPVGANFRAIGARFGRYMATLIVSAALLLIMELLALANAFFVTGPPAALFFWIGFGLFGSWLTVGWTLLFQSTPAGEAPDAAPADDECARVSPAPTGQ